MKNLVLRILQILAKSFKVGILKIMQEKILKKIDTKDKIKYLIYEEQLGRGTYGKVHKAGLNTNPNQMLACKIIFKQQIIVQIKQSQQEDKLGLKNYVMNRIKQQIMAWKNVDHPNIVKFLGYSETEKNIYLMMEFCKHGTIKNMVNKQGLIQEAEAIPLIRDVIDATAYLHKHETIHRDIKAENILLHEGRAKLADFGFAKLRKDTHAVDSGTGIGTFLYMAPQLVDFKDKPRYSSKCDCWSIGVLIYFMLTGFYPFDYSKNPAEYKIQLRSQQIKFEKNIKISQEMKNLIIGALRYNQEDRSSSQKMLKQILTIVQLRNQKMDVQ